MSDRYWTLWFNYGRADARSGLEARSFRRAGCKADRAYHAGYASEAPVSPPKGTGHRPRVIPLPLLYRHLRRPYSKL